MAKATPETTDWDAAAVEGDGATPAPQNVTTMRQPADGTQVSAFPGGAADPPPGWIRPPNTEQFDSGDYLRAGPEIVDLVEGVLQMAEFDALRHVPLQVLWRRKGAPQLGDAPKFAGTEIASPVWRHISEGTLGVALNLYWQHFDELRSESSYVHPDTLRQHVHHALMGVEVGEEGALRTRNAAIQAFPETVARYGQYNSGIIQLAKQLELFAVHHGAH